MNDRDMEQSATTEPAVPEGNDGSEHENNNSDTSGSSDDLSTPEKPEISDSEGEETSSPSETSDSPSTNESTSNNEVESEFQTFGTEESESETQSETEIESSEIETETETELESETESPDISGNDIEHIVDEIVDRLQTSDADISGNDVSGNEVETIALEPTDYSLQLESIDNHLSHIDGLLLSIFILFLLVLIQTKAKHIIGGLTKWKH